MKSGKIVAALFAVCAIGPMAALAGSSTDQAASADGRPAAPAAGAIWSSIERAIHTQETFQNMERALSTEPEARFHALGKTAQAAYEAGYYDKAQAFARELLKLARHYPDDWYYGQAIATANIVLGRVMLKRDANLAMAEAYLLASEATLNTPFLKISGPNMSLAKDLLEAGDRAPVLEFLEVSRKSWTHDGGRPAAWEQTIRAGGVPNFGPNLLY
jgi:hypothetical protein